MGTGNNQYFRSQRQIVTQYSRTPGSYIAPLKFGGFNYNGNRLARRGVGAEIYTFA